MLLYRSPAFAMRSIVGVGMTPPNVLGTPKPESSVMMSRIFGAFLGGTTRGAHHAFDWRASFLITPPNFGSGGGSCLPLIVVVAPGEPGVPVVCICALAEGATAIPMAAKMPPRRICLADFIGVNPVCCCPSVAHLAHLNKRNLVVPAATCLWAFSAIRWPCSCL